MTNIYEFLDANNVSYERYDHPAVFTVEESKRTFTGARREPPQKIYF